MAMSTAEAAVAGRPGSAAGPPGRSRRPWPSRVSSGHLVMVLAGLVGALLTLALLRSADDTVPVAVAATDLAPGTVIGPGSLRTASVAGDTGVLGALVAGDELDATRGQVVARPIGAGELVRVGDLRAPAGDVPRSMSFPVARARAVGGSLRAGDRVDVIATDRSATARYVVVDAPVLAVDRGAGGALGTASDEVTLTLALAPDAALRLAAGLEAGPVTVVRATGAVPLSADQVTATSGGGAPGSHVGDSDVAGGDRGA